MSPRTRAALAAIVSAVLLAAGISLAAPASASSSCPSIMIVVARGTNEPAGQGNMASLASAIGNSTSRSMSSFALDYPASAAFPAYWTSVSTGEKNLQKLLTSLVASCPSSKYVLLGYSQGAQVIGNALDVNGTQLSSTVNKAIKAVVFYGDPTFVPRESYDAGTHEASMGGRFERPPGDLVHYATRLRSYCDANDVWCQFDGVSGAVHEGYFKKYNANATAFVDGKLGV